MQKQILCLIISAISGNVLAKYGKFKLETLFAFLLFFVVAASVNYGKNRELKAKGKIAFGLFSVLFSTALILGYHIHVESGYGGLKDVNYITDYMAKDAISFPFLIWGIFHIVKMMYLFLQEKKENLGIRFSMERKITWKQVLAVSSILFALWTPYFLTYYPGFIYGDTIDSIKQIVGVVPWTNHHPVLYTFFIKVCLEIGQRINTNTLGCAIYTIIQMLYMSICFGYMICWICNRFHRNYVWKTVLIMIYGCTPYIALLSIAMWKDPVFSASIVVYTLLLLDYIFTGGEIINTDKWYWFKYVFLMLIIIFTRNNGIYLLAFTVAGFFAYFAFYKKYQNRKTGKILLISLGIMIFSKVVTGPGYDYLGITKPATESYGLFLNQMARVVAYDGNMSKADKEYMNNLLPLELYESTYRPCCVDLLKFDVNFNNRYLEEGFFKTWFSMLAKNPRLFFESWELQTYGFWTVNQEEINYYSRNITGAYPRNLSEEGYREELEYYGLEVKNLLGKDCFREMFPSKDIFVPIGMIAWIIILLALFLMMDENEHLWIGLMPSLGVLLTLFVATPIFYWPRYAIAVQYLLPIYLILFLMKKSNEC